MEPNARYVHNWHIDAIARHLEAVSFGRINRLLINVWPGSMKSMLVSVLWHAWEWGPLGRRSLRYLTTSFNDGPVTRDTRKCRDLMLSEWYRNLWPEVVLTRTGETSFANSDTGSREGMSFGSLTSQRGDRLIIDDPHSVKTAESEAEREGTTRKFREGALNRLNDQQKSAIVVIMQRLHERDLSGVILDLRMPFVHLMLPMEFESDRRCETEIGFSDPRSYDGEIADAARFPKAVLDGFKRDMGSYAFAGQYQQRPAPREGGLFKRAWFEIVDVAPADASKVRSWDLASTARGGDWTAGVLMSRDRNGVYYIEHVERFQGDWREVKQNVSSYARDIDGKRVQVRIPEDPGQAGKFQAGDIISDLAGWDIRAERESGLGPKEVRANPLAAQCAAGNVKIIRDHWNSAFLDEMCSFPNGKHDDQVDAASGAFRQLTESRPMVISAEAMRRANAPGWGMRGAR